MSTFSEHVLRAQFDTLRTQPLCSGFERSAISLDRNYLIDDLDYAQDILGDAPEDVAEAVDDGDASPEWIEKWEAVADLLKRWLDDPASALDPDDRDPDPPPQREAILAAGKVAAKMVEWGWGEPSQVIPSNNCGVVFYHDEPNGVTASIRITRDQTIRLLRSRRGKLLLSRTFGSHVVKPTTRPLWEAWPRRGL